ncbi:MAG: cysteine hydrolase [Candidatus Solibacter usitatus]|nr:cysteine hydrolase [Candidatus Solibacter usitatus]
MTTVFLDIDTQIDFVNPSGALYVPGSEAIVPAVARLNRWAVEHGIALISTVDAHAENDGEFRAWPAHCVAGTLGQRKPAPTLVGQTVLSKQSVDCFTIPELPGLLERLGAERCVVYGVVTEICVRFAAFGLLKTGRRVELVTDAVKSLDEAVAAEMMAEFTGAGGVLTTVEAVCGPE